ncbi:hypothetical protein GUJ93_ZPchr0007g3880 [Zizania palustris]|uniref:Uncharacterized protein n=1 Tax=Zizania palustris TaxID=103762 RepID=A0A8J5SPU6_ZIZPA|nr:hypothetical protein GUJ93_ZPchr0007g3880 [Zizania palustris]
MHVAIARFDRADHSSRFPEARKGQACVCGGLLLGQRRYQRGALEKAREELAWVVIHLHVLCPQLFVHLHARTTRPTRSVSYVRR